MKTFISIALAFTIGSLFLAGCRAPEHSEKVKQTYSSFDQLSDHRDKDVLNGAAALNFKNAPLAQVLDFYQTLSRRTVIHGQLPAAFISISMATSMNRIELLQMLDTVLAQNGIAMVLSGDNFVKAVPVIQVMSESPPDITLPWQLLPDSSSIMSRTVHLTNLKAAEVVPMLMPLSNLRGSIVALQDSNVLVLRDYSSNIKQELQLLEELERKYKP